MSTSFQGSSNVLAALMRDVEDVLSRIGVMYRVFGRVKTLESSRRKVALKSYGENGRLIQDLFGIRVIVYFSQDCEIVKSAMRRRFEVVGESVDVPGESDFLPRRTNLVLRVAESKWVVNTESLPVDQTFELQIRTVFSEGWHEVEHDLRYRCASDWDGVPGFLRVLNGTLGALETAEWAMVSLFDGLAYHHYRSKNWEPMLRHKFRLRMVDGSELTHELREVLNTVPGFAKRLWRSERVAFVSAVAEVDIAIPWTFDNLVFLVAAVDRLTESKVLELRPRLIADMIESAFGQGLPPSVGQAELP